MNIRLNNAFKISLKVKKSKSNLPSKISIILFSHFMKNICSKNLNDQKHLSSLFICI
jgi:hypothetical protein